MDDTILLIMNLILGSGLLGGAFYMGAQKRTIEGMKEDMKEIKYEREKDAVDMVAIKTSLASIETSIIGLKELIRNGRN